MQRRTLLYGSGVLCGALLAGCTGAGDAGDLDEDDSGDDGDDEEDDDGEEASSDDVDDVPGLDVDALDLGDDVTLAYLELDGDELSVGIETSITDEDEAVARARDASAGVHEAVDDRDAFAAAVSNVNATVYDAGEVHSSYAIDVEWLLAWYDGDLTDEELLEKIDENET